MMANGGEIIGREGLGEVLYVVEDLIARLDGLSINHGDAVGLILRVDILKRMHVGLNVDDSVMETVDRTYNSLTNICNGRANGGEVHAVRQFNGRRGRPSFDINSEQVHYLLEQGFKDDEISRMLGVGKRTLERKMSSCGLSVAGMILFTSLFNFSSTITSV